MERVKIKMPYVLGLDSGAHSVFNQFLAAKDSEGKSLSGTVARQKADYSFVDRPEFKTYLKKYIEYLHKNKDHYDFYVTLDIIFEPQRTWDIMMELEAEGLKPIPVYHYGEDISWLHKYMDKYEYIGVGGLGQDVTKEKFLPFGDRVFKEICDSKGCPTIKIHGFAMASYDLMKRYPWYSVDATTPFAYANYGIVTLPKPIIKNKEITGYDYHTAPFRFVVTNKDRTTAKSLILRTFPKLIQTTVSHYLKMLDIKEEDLAEEAWTRQTVNMHYIYKMTERLSKDFNESVGMPWDTRFYLSGSPSSRVGDIPTTLNHLANGGVKTFYYLGTFFRPRPVQRFIEYRSDETQNRKFTRRPKAN